MIQVRVLVAIAFTKKEIRHISKKDRSASRANTQPYIEYFSVRKQFIFNLCLVYMLSYGESKTITSYVLFSMHTIVEYFKL